ncbi:MAG: peroxiredoxin [Candidatus Sungbacteria bacterium]|nr:peroxiredoxin [Candidatus Sungbacteria bacterium]
MFQVDQKFPSFSLEVYLPDKDETGRLALKDLAGKWTVLMFYPADFTFVCPTELADLNKLHAEFKKMNAEVVVASTDTVFTHKAWLEVEELLAGFRCVMAADHNGRFSKELGIYDEEKGMAQRATFIVDPEGVLRAVDIVADAIGRSAHDALRKLKALDFVSRNPGKVCPASWEEIGALEPSIKKAGKVYKEFGQNLRVPHTK